MTDHMVKIKVNEIAGKKILYNKYNIHFSCRRSCYEVAEDFITMVLGKLDQS
jgi:hypothetical protein